MRYSESEHKRYQEPSEAQVGYVVDVGVGHIEQFKFHEEFQVDFHLRRAGFLKMQELLNKKLQMRDTSPQQKKPASGVLKTDTDKFVAK